MNYTACTGWTKERTIEVFLEFYEVYGYRPSFRAIEDYEELPPKEVIRVLFVSYRLFLDEAGLPPYHPSKKDLIEALQRGALYLGRTPTVNDACDGLLTYGHNAFKRAFGSWNAAVKAAGLSANTGGRRRLPENRLDEAEGELAVA